MKNLSLTIFLVVIVAFFSSCEKNEVTTTNDVITNKPTLKTPPQFTPELPASLAEKTVSLKETEGQLKTVSVYISQGSVDSVGIEEEWMFLYGVTAADTGWRHVPSDWWFDVEDPYYWWSDYYQNNVYFDQFDLTPNGIWRKFVFPGEWHYVREDGWVWVN